MLRDIIGSGPINIILVIAASEPKEISTITAGTTTKGGGARGKYYYYYNYCSNILTEKGSVLLTLENVHIYEHFFSH